MMTGKKFDLIQNIQASVASVLKYNTDVDLLEMKWAAFGMDSALTQEDLDSSSFAGATVAEISAVMDGLKTIRDTVRGVPGFESILASFLRIV